MISVQIFHHRSNHHTGARMQTHNKAAVLVFATVSLVLPKISRSLSLDWAAAVFCRLHYIHLNVSKLYKPCPTDPAERGTDQKAQQVYHCQRGCLGGLFPCNIITVLIQYLSYTLPFNKLNYVYLNWSNYSMVTIIFDSL